jgi:hypothetical protein
MSDNARKFSQIWRDLYALADSDPAKAISKARASETFASLRDIDGQSLKSAILIDAGSRLRS